MSRNVNFLEDVGWKGKYHESSKPTPNSQIVQGKKEKVYMYNYLGIYNFMYVVEARGRSHFSLMA